MRRLRTLGMVALSAVALLTFCGFASESQPIDFYFMVDEGVGLISATQSAQSIALLLSVRSGLLVSASVTRDISAIESALLNGGRRVVAFLRWDAYISLQSQVDGLEAVAASVESTTSGKPEYYYWMSTFYASRNSEFQSLQDCAGKVWIHEKRTSHTSYIIPEAIFAATGVMPLESIEAPNQYEAMVALLEGKGDFCTGFGIPFEPRRASLSDQLSEHSEAGALGIWDGSPAISGPIDIQWEGGDLRQNVESEYPDVWSRIGIFFVSSPLPFHCVAVHGVTEGSSDALVAAIAEGLESSWELRLWNDLSSFDVRGMQLVTDESFDFARLVIDSPILAERFPLVLGYSSAEILTLLDLP